MHIIEISSQKQWDEFVVLNGDQFLQSWAWGEFQKKIGRRIWRLGIKDDNNIIGQALIVKHSLLLGKNYFYCPRGPIFSSLPSKKVLKIFIEKIKDLARQENAIFFRFEPQNIKLQVSHCKKVSDVQPCKTLTLDLTQSEQEILSNMHYKTRYNIRLAQRHKVEVYRSKDQKDVEEFLHLLHKTCKREKFKPHPDNYYQSLLSFDPKFIQLYLVKYEDKILAAYIVVFFGNTATYVHGASSRENANVMAPHFLHWYTITQAKNKGYKAYDFWGIDKKKWPGLTRYKMGFGGELVTYIGTFDLPISNPWYWLYKIGKTIIT